MGVKNRFTVYPFAEMFEVESESTDIVKIWAIPAYTLIERVIVEVKTPGVRGAGAVTLSIGDTTTADGYIVASDALGAAGTVYGDVTSEIGSYLKEALTPDVATCLGKLYTAAGEYLELVLSAIILSTDTECVLRVFVFGKRFDV